MHERLLSFRVKSVVALTIFAIILFIPFHSIAKNSNRKSFQGKWWDTTCEMENPSSYYDSILYCQIGPKLREIEKNSNRVKVDIIGQSAGGRDLYLVTVSAPEALGRLGQYQAIRNKMLKDPEKAQEMIDKFGDFKMPVFINGSIHGNEYPGVDAAIRLIETLAYEDTEEVLQILNNVILLVNVVQNPDGRVLGTRANSKGIDLNRDFISQTQPEVLATVKLIREWNPMAFWDLHDDFQPMLIEPCSPPHNPNYEYDLYIQWALYQAYAMEAELVANTEETEAIIPFRDWDFSYVGWSWDDWPPIYTPMYAMYHGSYGHTLETPYEDERGVDAHYWAVWGALKFVAQNRAEMVKDQIEIYRRGFLDLPQLLIPQYILEETEYEQYNELTIQEFPAAYVIPADDGMQISTHQPARLIDFLIFNDVLVEKATQSFVMDAVTYPEGSYIVWMDQPKRGLANTILSDGIDVSGIEGIEFYSPPTAWSHPLLWGVHRAVMDEKMYIQTTGINKADSPVGSRAGGNTGLYAYRPTSIATFAATNQLIEAGTPVYRSKEHFSAGGDTFNRGTLVVQVGNAKANELVNRWALDLTAIEEMPEDVVQLKSQKIAVSGDAGVGVCLEELGFAFDFISDADINSGQLSNYDLFIVSPAWWWWPFGLNEDGRKNLVDFIDNGGDYIGINANGVVLMDEAGILDLDYDANWVADVIIQMSYAENNAVGSAFDPNDFGYFLGALWLEQVPANFVVTARIADQDDFLVSGYWPEWEASEAAGKPVVIHGKLGDADMTLVGMDATFRGHPKNGFRLIGNAIFNGMD